MQRGRSVGLCAGRDRELCIQADKPFEMTFGLWTSGAQVTMYYIQMGSPTGKGTFVDVLGRCRNRYTQRYS